MQVECNMCRCRNGRLACTNRRCQDADRDDRRKRSEEDSDEDSKSGSSSKSGKSRGRKPGPITADDPCYGCWDEPPYPVCAPDGHTYLSECFAVHCGGHSAEDLLLGPCSNYVRLLSNHISFNDNIINHVFVATTCIATNATMAFTLYYTGSL